MEVFLSVVASVPFFLGVIFIIMGHKNASKAKKMISDNGKPFTAMLVVARIHAICGYVLVGLYASVIIFSNMMVD